MPKSNSIADSTDWLFTPLAPLAAVESSLRCQVCKDFFDTPVITSCSHTFCSLCIRRCLSNDGRCPACRAGDQELKLRKNWVMEELVANFTASRDELLEVARRASVARQLDETDDPRPKKRRKADVVQGRSTRSQSRTVAASSSSTVHARDNDTVEDGEDDAGSEYEQDDESSPHFRSTSRLPPPPPDGLVPCPCCNRRMKADVVYSHLDTCTGTPHRELPVTNHIAYSSATNQAERERLPTLAYAMLNDNALRKKLRDLGISALGPKPLMQKRHTEWVNLWNANCDSRHPRSKRELLAELDVWERTLGRQIMINTGPVGVMDREFDGDNWARENRGEFGELIRLARRGRDGAKKVEERVETEKGNKTPPPPEPLLDREHVQPIYENPRLTEYPSTEELKPTRPEEGLSSQARDIAI